MWEGTRLLGEVNKLRLHVYVYDDQQSYTPLARLDDDHAHELKHTRIHYFHTQPNGAPDSLTDEE